MCRLPRPQQDWEQGWLWRGLGETDAVVPGQRVKSPNISSGDIWLKLWGDKDVFQGPTFLSQPERGDRRHSHSVPEFTHLHGFICQLEEQPRKPQPLSGSRCPGGCGDWMRPCGRHGLRA